MVLKRRYYPELYELVIGTVKKIYDHGAIVTLDEYRGIEAYCPLSELVRSWFRSAKDVVREGGKAVFKVIRVDTRRGHVDLSLRKVSDKEKKSKMFEWKRALHADKLLEIAAKKLRKSLEDAYREAGWKLEDHYGEIYSGFEEAARRGIEALYRAGISEEWAKVLYELAKEHVAIREVKISGVIILRCLGREGIKSIKNILTGVKSVIGPAYRDRVKIYTIGAPRYRVDITAYEYKTAEKILKDILEYVTKKSRELGCEMAFERLKKS
ncbi:MAG: translation initiation factor IF-2 subunit alpha [Thermoprotei archaeon]|nr:MAG: translation initiation factor IF-2 subunit alpha [Thermoprotei archaeon]